MTGNAQLDGRVAIVTGGSRGIGRAIAEALLAAGASVAITGRNTATLQEAEAVLSAGTGETGASAGRVLGVEADVRVEGDAQRLVDETVARFGGLDILVNNAGVGRFANVAEMTPDAWREVIETNVSGVFYACHAALPHLKQRGGGWIINISSLAGKNPFIGGAAYCASKAALNAFTDALMMEVRDDDIRVSAVLPGSVQTSFGRNEFRGHTEASDWKLTGDDIARVVVDLLGHPARSLPSRVEIRPSRPKKS